MTTRSSSWALAVLLSGSLAAYAWGCSSPPGKKNAPLGDDATEDAGAPAADASPDAAKDSGIVGAADIDGDGYTTDTGDCDESDPLVNPGAFEYVGNGRDDDCDGQIDNPYVDCDQGEALDPKNPKHAALAMNICPAKFVLEANYAKSAPEQRAIRKALGPIKPRSGKSMLMLSTGKALAPGESGFVPPGSGSLFGLTAPRPVPYADNPKCPKASDKVVHDLADLQLSLRAPTNARALRFDIRFLSGEYPTFYCSQFNDAFGAIMQSSKYPTPKNVSHDQNGEFLSVNVAFWTTCVNIAGSYQGCKEAPSAVDGSGFGAGDPGGPHGATSWVTTTVPVTPGEKISLRLAIWDEGDDALDSVVLLDAFSWDIHPTDKDLETTVPDDPK